jgi:hypothetical protein
MNTKKIDAKTRVTVDLNENLYTRLGALEINTGANSKADVIRDALRVYEYLVNLAMQGAKFSVTKDGTAETVVLLGVSSTENQPSSSTRQKSVDTRAAR